MSKFTLEKSKQAIEMQLDFLKETLKETGTCIGFDKTNNNFIFFDKEYYSNTGKFKGFKINIKEFIW